MNRLFYVLGRHWGALLALNALIVTATVAARLMTYEATWEAEAKLVIPETTSKLDTDLGTLGSLRTDGPSFSQQVNPLKLQISVLQSDVVMERALVRDPKRLLYDDLEDYKDIFKIEAEEQTTTIQLSTVGDTPELAQQRLAGLIAAFEARLNELRTSENDARAAFSNESLSQAGADLNAARQELATFQQASGWVDTDIQAEELVKSVSALGEQVVQTEASAIAAENQAAVLSQQLGLEPTQALAALGLDANNDYQLIRQQLTQAVIDLTQAQSDYTNTHPQVQLLLRRRRDLEQLLLQFVDELDLPVAGNPVFTSSVEGRADLIQQMLLAETQATAQQLQSQQLQSEVDRLSQQLNLVPQARAELLSLQQQYDLAEGIYRGLSAQTQQSDISAFTAYPNVQTLDPPRVDTEPVGPNWKLILANALLASIVASSALVLVLEGRDPLVIPEDLRETPFNFVTRLPWTKAIAARTQFNNNAAPIDFQWLGTTVSAHLTSGSYLLVTSASPGEGKTTVTLGLAEALTYQGYKVLAVDTNTPEYDLCRAFGQDPTVVPPGQIVPVRSQLDLLIFSDLYRGQLSQQLQSLQSQQDYDYILIDSASVTEQVGPVLVNQFVHNVLFVIKQKDSRKRQVERSLRQLNANRTGVLGLAVNGDTTAEVDRLPEQSIDRYVARSV